MLEPLDCLSDIQDRFRFLLANTNHVTETMPSIPNASMSMSTSATASFRRAHIDFESQDHTCVRSIPELIEHNAVHNPHHLFCLQAQKQTQETGPQLYPISHLQLKHAISQCQALLLDSIKELKPPSTKDDGTASKGPLVALFLESDVGLLIYLYALLGLGVPVPLPYLQIMSSVGLSSTGSFALRTIESHGHSAPLSCH